MFHLLHEEMPISRKRRGRSPAARAALHTACVLTLLTAPTRVLAQTTIPEGSPPVPIAHSVPGEDYRIGPDDLLEISVLQAQELTRTVRVSGSGDISLPLVGVLRAGGMSIQQLEADIADRLREKYIRDPAVSVQVMELHSRPVAVMGAVRQPGVFQVRGKQTLLQVLSLAGGVADTAGETVVIVRAADSSLPGAGQVAPTEIQVSLADLIQSRGAGSDVAIHPGDIVKVQPAALVYVVGAVRKPGAFAVRGNSSVTVLRAVALAEGLTGTARRDIRLLRTDASGHLMEIPIDFGAIARGKNDDVILQAEDVLFVPVSGAKEVGRTTALALVRAVTLRGLW
jgi:polysaccharide biosynthesis/export protein